MTGKTENPNESSRTAAAETDDGGADQIYDTPQPRSGIATPKPDLQDKRLPGIMSYFTGQVRPASLQRLWSGTFSATTRTEPPPSDKMATQQEKPELEREPKHEQQHPNPPPSSHLPTPPESASRSPSEDQGPPLLPHEQVGTLSEEKPPPETGSGSGSGSGNGGGEFHPYPTPPASSRSSLRGAKVGEIGGDASHKRAGSAVTPPPLRKASISELTGMGGRRPSQMVPLTSSAVVTESNVHARHFSTPGSCRAPTSQISPNRSHCTSTKEEDIPEDPASVRQLKKLTSDAPSKSGRSTPSRSASSTQQVPRNDGQDERRTSEESSSVTSTQTPPEIAAAAEVSEVKGKLTIKISEARGLRKCRAPYVVAVFQRSELISGGPRTDDDDEDDSAISNVAMGGVPIQRQGSDPGRPMSIPMRSRQSSNTSTGEHATSRTRKRRESFTSPKWDAEAVL